MEIEQRPDKKLRQGFIRTLAIAAGSKNKQQVPLLAHSLRWGAKLFFIQGEGRGVSRGQAREVA